MREYNVNIDIQLASGNVLPVRFNKEVAEKAIAARDSLIASRSLSDDTGITALHPMVVALIDAGMNPKNAQRVVKESMKSFRMMAMDAALRSAMCNGIFENQREKGRVIVHPLVPIEMEDRWWDDAKRNDERLSEWACPLPRRDPNHPVEQKAALIDALFMSDGLAFTKFSSVFQDALTTLVMESWEAADVQVDGEGFHAGDVVGNS